MARLSVARGTNGARRGRRQAPRPTGRGGLLARPAAAAWRAGRPSMTAACCCCCCRRCCASGGVGSLPEAGRAEGGEGAVSSAPRSRRGAARRAAARTAGCPNHPRCWSAKPVPCITQLTACSTSCELALWLRGAVLAKLTATRKSSFDSAFCFLGRLGLGGLRTLVACHTLCGSLPPGAHPQSGGAAAAPCATWPASASAHASPSWTASGVAMCCMHAGARRFLAVGVLHGACILVQDDRTTGLAFHGDSIEDETKMAIGNAAIFQRLERALEPGRRRPLRSCAPCFCPPRSNLGR